MVESEQVLWIKIVEYYTGLEEAESANEAARLACTVRVLDTRAETRDDVRLWPDSREPHRETVNSSLGRIQRFGAERVSRELIEEMADRIAKLFYTYYEEPK